MTLCEVIRQAVPHDDIMTWLRWQLRSKEFISETTFSALVRRVLKRLCTATLRTAYVRPSLLSGYRHGKRAFRLDRTFCNTKTVGQYEPRWSNEMDSDTNTSECHVMPQKKPLHGDVIIHKLTKVHRIMVLCLIKEFRSRTEKVIIICLQGRGMSHRDQYLFTYLNSRQMEISSRLPVIEPRGVCAGLERQRQQDTMGRIIT